MLIASLKVFAGLKSLEVDSWGFLLPLSPMVWVATGASLLAVTGVLLLRSMMTDKKRKTADGIETAILNTGILLNQCMTFSSIYSLGHGIYKCFEHILQSTC